MNLTMPGIRCRVWRDGRVLIDERSLDDLHQIINDPSCLTWVDLVRPTPAQLQQLGQTVGLQAHAIEDALAPHERPKVTRHAGHLFFVTYATHLEDEATAGGGRRLHLYRVSGFMLPTALVTVRLDHGFRMSRVEQAWADNSDLLRYGPAGLVHGLLDVIVDGHFETIQALDDSIERIEDDLFDERRLTQSHRFQRRLYSLRKDLVRLRRVVLPMREVVNALLRHRRDTNHELSSWYDDLYDHVLRAAEWTESLRDMVSTVFETHLSLQDSRLNTIMKKLAGWGAIIAVPTAITGWFGQNIPFPGFEKAYGLWLSIVLIVGISFALYAIFKRQDWL